MKPAMGKKSLAVCAVVSVLAFIGVGFSAWYVSGTSSQSFSGNVQVGVVVGGAADVTIADEQENQSVVYAAPSDATDSSKWIFSDGEIAENLMLEYDFTFSNVTSNMFLGMSVVVNDANEGGVDYVSQFGEEYNKKAEYRAAVEKGYIADVSEVEIDVKVTTIGSVSYQKDGNIFSISGQSNGGSAHATLTFSWGEFFDGKNPYYKYAELTDEAERTEAADTLAYIAACLEGVTYSIVFTPIAGA